MPHIQECINLALLHAASPRGTVEPACAEGETQMAKPHLKPVSSLSGFKSHVHSSV